MRNLVFTIGFVGAGLVGAVGGRLLFPGETVGVDLEAPALAESRLEELENRMERLAGEVRALRQERLAPAPDPLAAVSFDATPGVAPPGPVDAPASAAPVSAAAAPGEIEEKVVEIIEAREREQRERKAKWAEVAQVKKEAAWLGRLKEPLGLTDRQIKDLLRLLADRRATMAEYRRNWAERGDGITEAEQAAIKAEAADYGRRLDGDLRAMLSIMRSARSARGGGK